MPYCTIEELKNHTYCKLEPEKLVITKGECFVGRFLALTDETWRKDGQNKPYKRLVIEDIDNKIYGLALFGFHDRLISGVKLIRRGDIVAVACIGIKDGKFPNYAISLLKPEIAEKIAYKAPTVGTSAGSDDDIPF